MYGFVNYLTYILYAPLYIAGPIMTFNDFMWQVRTFVAVVKRSLTRLYSTAHRYHPPGARC